MIEYSFNENYDFDDFNPKNIFYKLNEEREKGITGYYNLPNDSMLLIKEIKEFSSDFSKNASKIAVIGIGGSSLGTKTIYSILKHKYSLKEMIFLENPDPIDLEEKFKKIDENTLFIVVSKSGKTIETISIFKAILGYFNLDLKKDKKRFIFISDENSPLCNLADENNIKFYSIPKNVGGRFSVFSAVGVVPLMLSGINMKEILIGAKEMIDRFFEKKEMHIIKKAFFLAKNYEKFVENVLFAYSNILEDFSKWYVQLIGESIGKIKDNKRVGITPIAHIGSIDQHSFLQLIMEGPLNKSVTFLKIRYFESDLKIPDISLPFLEETNFVNSKTFNELINKEADATYEAISSIGVPADMIVMDKISEINIGELMTYYMLLTSSLGAFLEINTYNQPGVELGKKILRNKFEG